MFEQDFLGQAECNLGGLVIINYHRGLVMNAGPKSSRGESKFRRKMTAMSNSVTNQNKKDIQLAQDHQTCISRAHLMVAVTLNTFRNRK